MSSINMIRLPDFVRDFCHPSSVPPATNAADLSPRNLRSKQKALIHLTETIAQPLFSFIQTHPELVALRPFVNRAVEIYPDNVEDHYTRRMQHIFNAIITEMSVEEQAVIPQIDLIKPMITQQVKDYNLCQFIDGMLPTFLSDYENEGYFNSLAETILNATSLSDKATRIRQWLHNHQNEILVIRGLTVRSIDAPLTLIPEEIGLFRNLEGLEIANHIAMYNEETTREEYLRGEREFRQPHHQHQIRSIPECLRNLTRLEELNLHNNQISDIPNWIEELSSLRVLGLAGNKISSVPSSIGRLNNLVGLNLNFNEIPRLPDEFTNLTNLQILRLRGNGLTQLPVNFDDLTRLKELDLAHNQLSTLPDFTFSELDRLNLAHNLLTALPNAFHPPRESLSLAHNRFRQPSEGARNLIRNAGPHIAADVQREIVNVPPPSLMTKIRNIASTILATSLWPFYQLFAAINWVITKIGEGFQHISCRVRGVAATHIV